MMIRIYVDMEEFMEMGEATWDRLKVMNKIPIVLSETEIVRLDAVQMWGVFEKVGAVESEV